MKKLLINNFRSTNLIGKRLYFIEKGICFLSGMFLVSFVHFFVMNVILEE